MRPGPLECKPQNPIIGSISDCCGPSGRVISALPGRLRDPPSSLDYYLWRDAPRRCAALDLLKYLGGDLAIDFGVRAVRLGGDHRHAGIRFLADRHVQRHFAEERHALAFGFLARSAIAENIRARAAARAQEIAHVLDDAEHRYIHALEHGDAAPRVD